jgi:hydroxymethylbilane synthase
VSSAGTQRVVLGTRGSELALAQTRLVEQALAANCAKAAVEIRVVRTSGDENATRDQQLDVRAGRKGLFTAEIEKELLAGNIDAAVHSAKDLPSDATPETKLAAVLTRASVNDVVVAKSTGGLAALPTGAGVGTSSVRRRHQLAWKRPDLCPVELRGNVPTRLRKLATNDDLAAIILARAGMERLSLDLSHSHFEFAGAKFHIEVLAAEEFLPAGGQGCIAVQTRDGDISASDTISLINDPDAALCLRAERCFLRLLNADCNSPIGVLATISDDTMTIRAQVFRADERAPHVGEMHMLMRATQPEEIAAALYSSMYGE